MISTVENLVLVSSTGDDHLSGAKDKADDLGVVEVGKSNQELLWLVLNLVKGKVEGQVV